MKNRLIPYFLLGLVLSQSCVTYKSQPVSINQATETGKVKVVTNNGRRVIFDNLLNEGGNYFGIYDNKRIPIDTTRTTSFYLRMPSYHHDKYYRLWVYLKDKNSLTKGYLYEVKDSSILVSLSKLHKQRPVSGSSIREFQVTDIEKIKLRRINNVGRGALIGFSISAVIALALPKDDLGYGAGLLFFTVTIGTIGTLLGTMKKSYEINGSIERYTIYRHNWREFAYIKDVP